MPRKRRVKGQGESYYHIICRVIEQQLYFTPEENLLNVQLMRKVETFSGVQILAFCFMTNHVHLLLRVPKREDISSQTLLDRIETLYGKDYRDNLEERWQAYDAGGCHHVSKQEQNVFKKRMYDMGEFMKTLKQRITMSYNKRKKRLGSLWTERYKSILLEPTPRVLSAVASYIDLNPVRANMVSFPNQYPFSSYGEASRGEAKAQIGLLAVYQGDKAYQQWPKFDEFYRELLNIKALSKKKKQKTFLKKKQKPLTKKGIYSLLGEDPKKPLAHILYRRIWVFSWGRFLGSDSFVEENRNLLP